jgi:hypothetical protein
MGVKFGANRFTSIEDARDLFSINNAILLHNFL